MVKRRFTRRPQARLPGCQLRNEARKAFEHLARCWLLVLSHTRGRHLCTVLQLLAEPRNERRLAPHSGRRDVRLLAAALRRSGLRPGLGKCGSDSARTVIYGAQYKLLALCDRRRGWAIHRGKSAPPTARQLAHGQAGLRDVLDIRGCDNHVHLYFPAIRSWFGLHWAMVASCRAQRQLMSSSVGLLLQYQSQGRTDILPAY